MKEIRQECPSDQLYSIEEAQLETPGCRWIKTNIVEGSGEDGVVYRVCKECDNQPPVCLYVVKHLIKPASLSNQDFQKHFQREVQMHTLLKDSGIAPKVYDAFICGNEGYILIDRKNYSIRDYAFKLFDLFKKAELVNPILDQLQTSVVRLLSQLHTYGYIHGDPHLKNFMIDVQDTNLTDWRNPQIIDFGKSEKVESPLVANQTETPKEIEMSFKMLKKDLADREKQLQDNDPQSVARRAILDKGIPEAPRKGKSKSAQPPSSAKKALENPEQVSAKKLKPLSMDFESPVKDRPLMTNLFGSSPSPFQINSQPNFEMEDSISTPIKMSSFQEMTPMTPMTPIADRDASKVTPMTPTTPPKEMKELDDDEWAPSASWGNRFDDDDEDDSFLSRRFYPYRVGGEDRYVDMIDPDYYDEDGYDGDSEYLNEWEPDN